MVAGVVVAAAVEGVEEEAVVEDVATTHQQYEYSVREKQRGRKTERERERRIKRK